jgi:uncharacterized protein (DUF885 family)
MSVGNNAERFSVLAHRTLDELVERDPELGTSLGDHRFDDRLTERSASAMEEHSRWAAERSAQIDALDVDDLALADQVDLKILQNRLSSIVFELSELREHTWNPLASNPGNAIYSLLARDFAPRAERLRSAAARLSAVPATLAAARSSLEAMPQVHVETAIGQFAGTRTLLVTDLEDALAGEPLLRDEVEPVRSLALDAIDEHIRWLQAQRDAAPRDPRLGPERFARKLSMSLETTEDADAVLARAEQDLAELEERIAETAVRIERDDGDQKDRVRRVLGRLADDGEVTDDTVVGLCEQALVATTDFVRRHDLVTVYDDPVEIIVMPEIHRGVAVAYCDPPGPLEQSLLPTYFAVSPTPADWSPERVRSFFREYNLHMLHNLTVHEAMPGHVLQLAHNNRQQSKVPVRKALWNGAFVEGWAVYAEELMVDERYRAEEGAADALHMQQLKMQLRMTINAILDARVHAHGMTEEEAMRMMMGRGHQEEGEAAGKWRRALLTSGQLSTYYVGYVGVADLARDVAAAHPDWPARQRHDAMLAHGSPAPHHLRALLSL